jgi:phospholipase C
MFSTVGYSLDGEEFNINDYTWEDIMTMSNSEFRTLLTNFERVYDPFGTYETEQLTAIYSETTNGGGVQPRWTSGDTDILGNVKETGSHELITARACGILLDDKGFWGTDESGSILIALTLSLASIIPDRNLVLGALDLFKGHFYDPDTGENWAGGSSNTAKTNAEKFYNKAIEEYEENGNTELFIENVGKLLHYVQDACEPHHAANITALENGGVHTEFEEFADANLDSYIDQLTTVSNYSYQQSLSNSIGIIVHNAAVTAKGFSGYVDDINDQSRWGSVAGSTTRNAVRETAIVLYKLSIELSIPLT